MSWLIRVFIENPRMSHFFFLSLPTSLSCHYPTWSGNLFVAVANFPDASVKPGASIYYSLPLSSYASAFFIMSCLDFLYSVMPRLFPCHLLSHPPGTARPGNWNSLVPREQTAAGGCCHSIVKTMLFLIWHFLGYDQLKTGETLLNLSNTA